MDANDIQRLTPKIERLVSKTMRRYHLNRVSLDEEDAVQECLIAALQAFEKYDPSKGFALDAYLMTCASNRLTTLLQVEFYKQRWEQSEVVESGGAQLSLFDLVPCDQRPDDDHLRERTRRDFIQGLSPIARVICQWLIDPPPALKRQWNALRHKVALADRVGIEHREAMRDLGFRFIRKLLLSMGLSESIYKSVRRELSDRMELST